nr:hypothetical protein [Tanacetum cinerariifolium]
QWLDLKYDDHTILTDEVNKSVIAIWSYKNQFEEYMEIKKQKEVHGIDVDMEYDPSYIDFEDDEEVLANNELSNPKDGNLIKETEIDEIFRIETDIL